MGIGRGRRGPKVGEGEFRILPLDEGSVRSDTASRRVYSSGNSREPSVVLIPSPMRGLVPERGLECDERVLIDGIGLGGRGRECGDGFGLGLLLPEAS